MDETEMLALFEKKLSPEVIADMRSVGQSIKLFMQEVGTPGKTEWLLNAMHDFGFPPSVCVSVVLLMTLDGIIVMNGDGWISLSPEHREAVN